MRETRDVGLGIILTVSDHRTLHAHACMVWIQMTGSAAGRLPERAWAAHLEKRVHLLLSTHLVAQYAVSTLVEV